LKLQGHDRIIFPRYLCTMSDAQARYRAFCATAPPDFPVFMQPWYLDAVCRGGVWQAVVCEQQGRVVGVWPFFLKKKWHWRYVAMPQMGKLMGPYVVPDIRSDISADMRVLAALADQLPAGLAAFEQDCNYGLTNWLPLYWRGFTQTTRYSYHIGLDAPEAQLWANVESNYKRKMKKAQQLTKLSDDLPLDELYRLCALSFERQGVAFPLGKDYFLGICEAFFARGQGKAFYAIDPKNNATHSAIFLIWDQGRAYLLFSGDDPAYRQSGTGIWLQWEAIRYAKNTLRLPFFDFEGSMLQPIEQSRRYLGGIQQPYFRLRKEWNVLWRIGKFLLR
jgi:hypothetical protein